MWKRSARLCGHTRPQMPHVLGRYGICNSVKVSLTNGNEEATEPSVEDVVVSFHWCLRWGGGLIGPSVLAGACPVMHGFRLSIWTVQVQFPFSEQITYVTGPS